MKVAFCSSEVFPFSKTGGLADVCGALPFALAKAGCEVKVFTPFYKDIKPQWTFPDYGVSKHGEVEFFFIRNDKYFTREFLYGTPQEDYPDNLERFSFFSRQVFNVLKKIDFAPRIIHSNDWQTALVNIYLKTKFGVDDFFFSGAKCVFTIHNLAYQGLFEKDKYPLLDLPWAYFDVDGLEFYDKINLLKGAVVFSDMINTVSPVYAKQIQTPDYGCGLDGVLREKRGRLNGILNAIDYEVWNPQTDKFIYKPYSSSMMEDKEVNKRMFQKEGKLTRNKNSLLIGMVSRLAEQKGLDILLDALDYLLKKYQLVILGYGDQKYHERLKEKEKMFQGSFSLYLKFDERLAHKIYAGCDCFLIPSRFEPCGLSQLISYKYGTLPVAHYTGGLADTVEEVSLGGGGFVFSKYSSDDLIDAVERAADLFRKKEAWDRTREKVMQYNFSWETTAEKYIGMYKKCLSLG